MPGWNTVSIIPLSSWNAISPITLVPKILRAADSFWSNSTAELLSTASLLDWLELGTTIRRMDIFKKKIIFIKNWYLNLRIQIIIQCDFYFKRAISFKYLVNIPCFDLVCHIMAFFFRVLKTILTSVCVYLTYNFSRTWNSDCRCTPLIPRYFGSNIYIWTCLLWTCHIFYD